MYVRCIANKWLSLLHIIIHIYIASVLIIIQVMIYRELP